MTMKYDESFVFLERYSRIYEGENISQDVRFNRDDISLAISH